MRRSEMRLVIDFAIGGEPPVEGVAIPGGGAYLSAALVFFRIVPLAGDLIGVAKLVAAAAARQARALARDPGACLHAIFGFREIFLRARWVAHAVFMRRAA